MNENTDRTFYDDRSRMLQAWEDLTAAGIPARLGMDLNRAFVIDVKGGELGIIQRVCEQRGLTATAGNFGVTLTIKREDVPA